MRIQWTLDCGYVTENMPFYVEVPDEEIQDCADDEEVERLVMDSIQDVFEQEITWSYKEEDMEQAKNLRCKCRQCGCRASKSK